MKMSATDTRVQPCQCLRTKNIYGTSAEGSESWLPGIHATSNYWCLRTMGTSGPDDHYVHLARCSPGRACYEAAEK
jgi:hypothetical protein